jgi:hypothetical protein
MALVAETLRRVTKVAIADKAAFRKSVLEKLSARQTDDVKKQKKRLTAVTKRLADLEMLQRKIYEDNALGKLPDKRYAEMAAGYDAEQSALEAEQAELQSAVEKFTDGNERADKFIALIERYENFDEISVAMLSELVEKIVVHERDRKGASDTTQKIDIHLTFVGKYDFPAEEISPEEQARLDEERRKREATKDRLHQNYLRRKESGKQAEYERKYAARREARLAERKAAAKEEVSALANREGKAPIWEMSATDTRPAESAVPCV